jgi:predicted enzyme related to lactoylglutathione lyase
MTILGVSGIFLDSDDPAALSAWYTEHFGFTFNEWEKGKTYGFEFFFRLDDGRRSHTVFSLNKPKEPLGAARRTTTVNLRVENLSAFAEGLRAKGLEVKGPEDYGDMGAFAWVKDPEGNRLELYQPTQEPGA